MEILPMSRRYPGQPTADLHLKESTRLYSEFKEMCSRYRKRTRVIAEGDSWFAYPPKSIIGGSSNVIDYFKSKEKFNLLELARNGDEIVDILSGESKFNLLHKIASTKIDFLLISGGGNDLVGAYDFEYLLSKNTTGKTPSEFINKERLDRKISQISNAYYDLVDYCRIFSKNKNIVVLTHCYGYAIPQNRPAEFLFGLIDSGPWMYPALKKLKIPKKYWHGIVKIMINRLKRLYEKLQKDSNGKFFYIDSTKLISDDDWIDEMHLKPKAFDRVASSLYELLVEIRN